MVISNINEGKVIMCDIMMMLYIKVLNNHIIKKVFMFIKSTDKCLGSYNSKKN